MPTTTRSQAAREDSGSTTRMEDNTLDEHELNGGVDRRLLKGSEPPEDVAHWLGRFSRSAQYSSARKGLPEVLQTIAASVDQTGVAWEEVGDMMHSEEWCTTANELQAATAGTDGVDATEDGESAAHRRSVGALCAKLYGIFDQRMRRRFVTRRVKADSSKLLSMKMDVEEDPQDFEARVRKEISRVAPTCSVQALAARMIAVMNKAEIRRRLQNFADTEAANAIEALHDILSGAETVDSLQEHFDESKVAAAKRVVELRETIKLRREREAQNPEAYPEAMRTADLSEVQLVLTVLVTKLLKHAQGLATQLRKANRDEERRTAQDAPQLLLALEKLAVPKFNNKTWCDAPCDLHPNARIPHRCGTCSVYVKMDKIKGGNGKPRYDSAYAAIKFSNKDC